MTGAARRLLSYAGFGLRYFVLRSDGPIILGLATNDTCNLQCIGCRVANVGRKSLSYERIREILTRYYDKGVRFLYLEGGEPLLWRDGRLRLRDVVALARDIGYLRVHVYTNGTLRIDAGADLTWISIDGLGETFRRIRGIPLERVLRRVRQFEGRRAIVFVVNTVNQGQIREFLEFCVRGLPGAPVMFYFHTPYYGIDALLPSKEQREAAVDTLLACKRDGLPVMNSRAGLEFYLAGNPGMPTGTWWVVDPVGEYRCCRASGTPELCRHCGYTMCGEIVQARRGHPGALRTLMAAR